jgi:hypothetical protein
LGEEGFSWSKMSMRRTYSEFIPEKLCFGVKIVILVSAKIFLAIFLAIAVTAVQEMAQRSLDRRWPVSGRSGVDTFSLRAKVGPSLARRRRNTARVTSC